MYFQLGSLLHHPVQYLNGFLNYIAGLWSAFLVLTYLITGVGETQSFLAWFWYVFALLLLVIWVARVTGDRTIAVLLALAISYQLGFDWRDVMEANLADSRPDPLAHALSVLVGLWALRRLLSLEASRWASERPICGRSGAIGFALGRSGARPVGSGIS